MSEHGNVRLLLVAAAACGTVASPVPPALASPPVCDEWQAVPGIANNYVQALMTWDPDGAGSLGEVLVAGGEFTAIDGATAHHIAYWDGVEWHPFGEGFDGPVWGLSTWDPDGSGPLIDHLIATGNFTASGSTTTRGIAMWNGTQWEPLGQGFGNAVDPCGAGTATAWDADGDPSTPASLVAGGCFRLSGQAVADHTAIWNGTSWIGLGTISEGTGLDGNVEALAVWDADGDGPLRPDLFAGGSFGGSFLAPNRKGIARRDGIWLDVGNGLRQGTGDGFVSALLSIPIGSSNMVAPGLLAGGRFNKAGDVFVNNVARWNGATWQTMGSGLIAPGMDFAVYDFAIWDPDGNGPLPRTVVVCGEFTSSGAGVPLGGVAWWDGSDWAPLGAGLSSTVLVIAARDPEGLGGTPFELFAGGYFSINGGTDETIFAVFVPCDALPPPCPGDLTGDDRTTILDFNILAAWFGESVPPGTNGDLNGDGIVNISDFSIVAGDFGCEAP